METDHARRSNSRPSDPATATPSSARWWRPGRPAGPAAHPARHGTGVIEALWAAFLVVAASHRHSWSLALLLVLKWFLNYAAFIYVSQWAPVLMDIALGTVGVIWASRRREEWAGVVTAGFVVTPLIHGWYWIQHTDGTADPVAYYLLITGVFTAQVAALAWPACHDPVRAILHWLDIRVRRGVAGLAGRRCPAKDERGPGGAKAEGQTLTSRRDS